MSKPKSSKLSKKNDDDPDSVDVNEIVDSLQHSNNTFTDESAAYLAFLFDLNSSEILASSEADLSTTNTSSEERTSREEATKGKDTNKTDNDESTSISLFPFLVVSENDDGERKSEEEKATETLDESSNTTSLYISSFHSLMPDGTKRDYKPDATSVDANTLTTEDSHELANKPIVESKIGDSPKTSRLVPVSSKDSSLAAESSWVHEVSLNVTYPIKNNQRENKYKIKHIDSNSNEVPVPLKNSSLAAEVSKPDGSRPVQEVSLNLTYPIKKNSTKNKYTIKNIESSSSEDGDDEKSNASSSTLTESEISSIMSSTSNTSSGEEQKKRDLLVVADQSMGIKMPESNQSESDWSKSLDERKKGKQPSIPRRNFGGESRQNTFRPSREFSNIYSRGFMTRLLPRPRDRTDQTPSQQVPKSSEIEKEEKEVQTSQTTEIQSKKIATVKRLGKSEIVHLDIRGYAADSIEKSISQTTSSQSSSISSILTLPSDFDKSIEKKPVAAREKPGKPETTTKRNFTIRGVEINEYPPDPELRKALKDKKRELQQNLNLSETTKSSETSVKDILSRSISEQTSLFSGVSNELHSTKLEEKHDEKNEKQYNKYEKPKPSKPDSSLFNIPPFKSNIPPERSETTPLQPEESTVDKMKKNRTRLPDERLNLYVMTLLEHNKKMTVRKNDLMKISKTYYRHLIGNTRTASAKPAEPKTNLKIFTALGKTCNSSKRKSGARKSAAHLQMSPTYTVNLNLLDDSAKLPNNQDDNDWYMCSRENTAHVPIPMKMCTYVDLFSMVSKTDTQKLLFLTRFYEKDNVSLQCVLEYEWVPNSKDDPELSDAMYRRIRDNRKESEKSLNEIFPFDQVPLTMLDKELVENVYRNLETSTLPQILIGCVSSPYLIHIPFNWEYFINGVQFFHSSKEFSMQNTVALVKTDRTDVSEIVVRVRRPENRRIIEFINDDELEASPDGTRMNVLSLNSQYLI